MSNDEVLQSYTHTVINCDPKEPIDTIRVSSRIKYV